jgi:hypothetical protein
MIDQPKERLCKQKKEREKAVQFNKFVRCSFQGDQTWFALLIIF